MAATLMQTNLPIRPRSLNFHHTRHFGEERIVLAPADVRARLDLGAALPHDDRAHGNKLAAEDLHAQPLRVRIAPVLELPKPFLCAYVTYAELSPTFTCV